MEYHDKCETGSPFDSNGFECKGLKLTRNRDNVKDVLSFIKRNSTTCYANRPENVIIRYYESQGRKIVVYYVSFVYASLLSYITVPGISVLINAIVPSNQSQEKTFLFELDYGVDKEKYYYYVCLHTYTATCIAAHIIAVCDTTYMFYAHYASALFAIVSYQLRTVHIVDSNGLTINVEKDDCLVERRESMESLPRDEQTIYIKLLNCIKGHQDAIKYTNLIESLFAKCLLIQLCFNVLCLTVTGVAAVKNLDNAREVMKHGSFTFAVAVHVFFLCLPGQNLTNHSERVHIAACEVIWYELPRRCQNLYTFLLTRTLVASKLTAFKMASMSMETFLTITQTAMSYFTVLLSTS